MNFYEAVLSIYFEELRCDSDEKENIQYSRKNGGKKQRRI